MKNAIAQNKKRYEVRNNLYKFTKRLKKRLCDNIFTDYSMRTSNMVDMMESLEKLFNDTITDRMTPWALDNIIFLHDVTDEIEFAHKFYDYLIECKKDYFSREYDTMHLEFAIDLAYQM